MKKYIIIAEVDGKEKHSVIEASSIVLAIEQSGFDEKEVRVVVPDFWNIAAITNAINDTAMRRPYVNI